MSSDRSMTDAGGMPPRPTVSVALCTFNGGRFIRRQLDSILTQSMPPGEVIIADDGSTDGTLDLIDSMDLGSKWQAVRIIRSPVGLGVARNFERAVNAASGDLIALADQDDVWDPDRLLVQMQQFETRPELTLLHGDAALIGIDDARLAGSLFGSISFRDREKEQIHAGRAFETLLRRNVVTGATVMFRRGLLADAVPFGDGWVHDEWLAIIAAASGRVDFVDQPLIGYRQHGANQIGASDPSISHKLSRVFAKRGDRHQKLAHRSTALVERLESLPAAKDRDIASARAKERFESVRATMSRRRPGRVPAIIAELVGGNYRRYSSQGNLDVVRDLLQPA